MNYIKKRLNRNFVLLLFWDSLVITVSIYLSMLFRFDFNIPLEVKKVLLPQYFALLIILKIFFFRIFALYRGMWRYTSVLDIISITKANVFGSIIFILATIYIMLSYHKLLPIIQFKFIFRYYISFKLKIFNRHTPS